MVRFNLWFMRKLELTISLECYDSTEELSESECLLIETAQQATFKSYAPYSNFHVGAAVLLEDGSIHSAGNQENAAFPSGSCAEQSAIYWVGSNFPEKQIHAIAVVARPGNDKNFKPVSPCGACRQSLLEYEVRQQKKIRLIMLGADNQVIVSESIASLLPVKFDASDLH